MAKSGLNSINLKDAKQRLDALRKQQDINHEMYLNDIQLDDEIKQLKQDIALMEYNENQKKRGRQ